MADRTPTACDQCGATDDHPKLHYGTDTYHHDCVPAKVATSLPDHVQAFIEKARSGVRGSELLDHIRSVSKESK